MKRHGIQHFASEREKKAAVVERFNRTIKTRIWTYLSDRGTVRWVDIIQDLVDAYNNSRHRSISMSPADFQKKDENLSGCALLGSKTPTLNLKFRSEPWCGPAATRQFLIRATCQTGPRSTLQ